MEFTSSRPGRRHEANTTLSATSNRPGFTVLPTLSVDNRLPVKALHLPAEVRPSLPKSAFQPQSWPFLLKPGQQKTVKIPYWRQSPAVQSKKTFAPASRCKSLKNYVNRVCLFLFRSAFRGSWFFKGTVRWGNILPNETPFFSSWRAPG